MKKVQILHLISSLNRGGAETVLATLLKEWQEPLHEHSVIYFHDGPLRERIEQLGIKTYSIRGLVCRYDPLFVVRFIVLILRLKPQVIYSSLWAANFLGRISAFFLRTPIICAVHAVAAHEGKIRNRLDRWCPFSATKYVAVSYTIQKSLEKDLLFPTQKIIMIPNGICHSVKSNSLINRAQFFGAHADKVCVIGTVGRLVPVKNYALLLRVFAAISAQFPFIRLMIVGHGPEESTLKRLAAELDIAEKVIFIINQPAAAYYSLFDLFVQPSHYEGLSIALLEAMSHAVPVIVSGNNGYHEVITHEKNGLIITPTESSLKNALIYLMKKSVAERKFIGENGKKTVLSSFSSQAMSNSYKNLLPY